MFKNLVNIKILQYVYSVKYGTTLFLEKILKFVNIRIIIHDRKNMTFQVLCMLHGLN